MTGTFLVLNGRWSRFKTVTIPVDSIEVDELSPGPFLWLGLSENFLEKIIVLNVNLGAPSDYKNKKKTSVNKTMIKYQRN